MGLLGEDWNDRPRVPDLTKGKKKIYTCPQKKGGFGYGLSERTIGGKPLAYMADEYQRGRILGRELRHEARKRIPKPFNSMPNAGQGIMNSLPRGDLPGPTYMERQAKRAELAKPWKPSHPSRKAAYEQALSKVGHNYVSDPIPQAQVRYHTCRVVDGLDLAEACTAVRW